MDGEGAIVENDEKFIGKKASMPKHRGYIHKHAVMTLIERRPGGGQARSFHVEGQYAHIRSHFTEHDFTTLSKGEYVRDRYIHTDTVEGFYSVFKRGMKGICQHCGEQHLHCYVSEFDFSYNNRTRIGVDDT